MIAIKLCRLSTLLAIYSVYQWCFLLFILICSCFLSISSAVAISLVPKASVGDLLCELFHNDVEYNLILFILETKQATSIFSSAVIVVTYPICHQLFETDYLVTTAFKYQKCFLVKAYVSVPPPSPGL